MNYEICRFGGKTRFLWLISFSDRHNNTLSMTTKMGPKEKRKRNDKNIFGSQSNLSPNHFNEKNILLFLPHSPTFVFLLSYFLLFTYFSSSYFSHIICRWNPGEGKGNRCLEANREALWHRGKDKEGKRSDGGAKRKCKSLCCHVTEILVNEFIWFFFVLKFLP